MTFDVEVVLKGSDSAVTETIAVAENSTVWDEQAVHDMLVEVLRSIERAQNPAAPRDRVVSLTGFSWIVEPSDGQSVLAIEIALGAAVAGPFPIPQATLDTLITTVIRGERMTVPSSTTVH
jgi:hypothetical protein